MHQTYASKHLAIHCRVLRSLVSSSVSSRTMYIRQVAFHSIKWILSNLSMHLTILDLHLRSTDLQYVFPAIHPVTYVLFWWRRCTSVEWKWFFSRHVQFDSGFHMMAINEISCNRPEIIFSFRIILCRVRSLWGWRRESAWFSSKI